MRQPMEACMAVLFRATFCFCIAVIGANQAALPSADSPAKPHARSILTTEQRQTMLSMRDAAIIIEKYSTKHNAYPGPTPGIVEIESLRQYLTRHQFSHLPLKDGWGHSLLFWSAGSDYLIVSLG